MNSALRAALAVLAIGVIGINAEAASQPTYHKWAKTPPMGWNSWDCFGTSVTEDLTKANADYMAEKLAKYGWKYIVVDIQWYEPSSGGWGYRANAGLSMDEWGRLLPAVTKFPSAEGGKGFKALADYCHKKKLKFGIHMMRGIPKQAVEKNTPILGTNYHAADIADKSSTCAWNPDMYGVDTTKPGAQEYYDSIFKLVAGWGVDFVKVDDLSRPYHKGEIEAIRKAIDKCGRPIVFSTSPGETTITEGEHVSVHANMWRISDDFWDDWKALLEQFARCEKWVPYCAPGHWPDADMLPVGGVRQPNGWTNFTQDEQYTLISLWSICRSPLMIGGHMPKNDEFTLSLLTNSEVLAVDQNSSGGKQLYREGNKVVWVADVPRSKDKYVALFNTADNPTGVSEKYDGIAVPVKLSDLGFAGTCKVRDLWAHKDLDPVTGEFAPLIRYHSAGLYRVSPAKK